MKICDISIGLFLYEGKSLYRVAFLHCLSLPQFCVLVFKTKKKNLFKSIGLIFLYWITFLSSFIRAGILGLPHFSWVSFLFLLNNSVSVFFCLEYLSISCKYTVVSDYTIFSLLSLSDCDNDQNAYLNCILCGKIKTLLALILAQNFS